MAQALAELDVMVLDCQATGARPGKSRLLEVGWVITRASRYQKSSISSPESYLIRWVGDEAIPERILRITGITPDELASASALDPREVWKRLSAAAHEMARANHRAACPAVIHFSRFEEPLLRYLHQEAAPGTPFPFHIICTHEIVKRLLPDLPRRGLRAVAGFWGHSVPEHRRTTHHITATAFIWHHLVERLEQEHAIRTEAELRNWMEATEAAFSTGRAYPMDPTTRLALPDEPGVYRMRRSNGDLLYIGKARSLRRRVNSYFQKRRHHAEHTLEMLTQASRIDVTVTESAFEAAMLESDEIKRWAPPYNIALLERGRRIAFSSLDLKETRTEPDDHHRIGPLSSDQLLRPLGCLADLLCTGLDCTLEPGPENLGIHADYVPAKECFRSGVEMFQEKHSSRWRPPHWISALTQLGTDLWKERLESSRESLADEEEQQEGARESEEKRDWSPEKVVSWLENLTVRAAHGIRRARWLCLLSESALAWELKEGHEPYKNLLVFSEGAVYRREILPIDAPISSPTGHAKSLLERQRSFDLVRYDRLCVVTTELKRLISEGRNIELRLSPKAMLSPETLTRALQWV